MPEDFFEDTEKLSSMMETTHGRNEIIKAIYSNYYGLLESVVIKNSGTKEDAEDVIQDTILAFLNMIYKGTFKGGAKVSTLLYSMSRNLWIDKLRKKASAKKYQVQMDMLESSPAEDLINKEAKTIIMAMFEKIGSTCQNLLYLFYFEELSMKELLVHTEFKNEQVLRNRKSRCMKKLLELVESKPQWAAAVKSALQSLL